MVLGMRWWGVEIFRGIRGCERSSRCKPMMTLRARGLKFDRGKHIDIVDGGFTKSAHPINAFVVIVPFLFYYYFSYIFYKILLYLTFNDT